jgi:hypothetical protein
VQWPTPVADFLDDLYAKAEIEKAEWQEKLKLKERKKVGDSANVPRMTW